MRTEGMATQIENERIDRAICLAKIRWCLKRYAEFSAAGEQDKAAQFFNRAVKLTANRLAQEVVFPDPESDRFFGNDRQGVVVQHGIVPPLGKEGDCELPDRERKESL